MAKKNAPPKPAPRPIARVFGADPWSFVEAEEADDRGASDVCVLTTPETVLDVGEYPDAPITVTVVPAVAGNRYRLLYCCEQQPPEIALSVPMAQQYWPSRQSATGSYEDGRTMGRGCQQKSLAGR
jgi:hypothetical protein